MIEDNVATAVRASRENRAAVADAVTWARRHFEILAEGANIWGDADRIITEVAIARYRWQLPGTDGATTGTGPRREDPIALARRLIAIAGPGGFA